MPGHILLMIVAMLTAAPTLPESGDMGKIQGRWRLVKGQVGETGIALGEFSKDVWHFKRDDLIAERPNGKTKDLGPFKLDETTKPKRIDFKFFDGKTTHTRLGIYELLEGGRLRICFSSVVPPREELRPTDFTTPDFSGRILVEFEREK